ncbi:MAG: ornithine cyclodeaminase family protein [Saprospiraceae bacterium]|nr:ornithine cyclodeaminase family protein [Saprospiraceae bacterium]
MKSSDTLLLTRREVAKLLSMEECIDAVEQAFKLYATGEAQPPGTLGIHAAQGVFHIKAGIMNLGKSYFVAKTNANFPNNKKQYGLPTIQGIIVMSDAKNGRLLALMDANEITILRTAAATAVAAKYLSRPDSKIATIIGCGNQGRASLQALLQVRNLEKIYAYDMDEALAKHYAEEFSRIFNIDIISVNDFSKITLESDICVTCTPSKQAFLKPEHIEPGTFIAAVGADNEDKQELQSSLLASNKVVVDIIEQCANMGELHHALEKDVMKKENVHAELGQIIAGQKIGRASDDEIIIFDSTGMALQDVAAAAIVYEKAVQQIGLMQLNFGA